MNTFLQIGPEKGVTHLATAAIVNALWDLWARIEKKPLWKLLVDLTPEQLVSTIVFRYMLYIFYVHLYLRIFFLFNTLTFKI